MNIKENIETLLKHEKAYRISKETGVDQGNLSKIKKGIIELDNVNLGTAIKLNNMYLKMKKRGEI